MTVTDQSRIAFQSPQLNVPGVRHGFFGHGGGGSRGIFFSNNCGFGSGDDPAVVTRNRAACAAELGFADIVAVYQRHTIKVEYVEGPWPTAKPPVADAMVTATPGVALGILTADCAPVLFADSAAGIVGAAHAGWRGAFDGVVEATVAAMVTLGARREAIVAAVGPCIGAASYEVGPEFIARFRDRDPAYGGYFTGLRADGHGYFDLERFVADQARAAGISIAVSGRDTCGDEQTFFSYRRSVLRKEPDYGRQLSVIGIPVIGRG